jgi:thiol-disulfide isomerase/thioredoxin
MKKIFVRVLVLLLSAFLVIACSPSEEAVPMVEINGKLVNWGNASKTLKSDDIKADFGLGLTFLLDTNEEQEFHLKFPLTTGTYFSIGRNKLFIEPGETLNITVDYRDPEAGVFEGDGAERQAYLSGVAFPKSGSYLAGGSQVKENSFDPILILAQTKTMERQVLLDKLTDSSAEFTQLESMRLKLDYLNTILSFPVYGSFKDYWEFSEVKKIELLTEVKDILNLASNGILQDEYMVHPNFRDMILTFGDERLKTAGIFDGFKLTDFMLEYDAMGAFVTLLQANGLTSEMQELSETFVQGNHSEEYKGMVQQKVDEYASLKQGEPAFDVMFEDVDKNEVPLSAYKGKLIYVDLWATWCGPCIAELPAFEQLVKDYAGKNIAFVPVSIDTDLERWKSFMKKNNMHDTELVINRVDLDDYKVITIPRYLLIDQNFKIINVFATVPSDPETRKLIDSYL